MRTTKNILQHELIGMDVEISECRYPDKEHTTGMIIDETRNMLVLEQDNKDVSIPKQGTKLLVELPEEQDRPDVLTKYEINAEKLIARPEDRVKKNEPKKRRK